MFWIWCLSLLHEWIFVSRTICEFYATSHDHHWMRQCGQLQARQSETSRPLAVTLSWLENAYLHPVLGGFTRFSPIRQQRRSIAKRVGCFQRRLFVCLFVNTIISKRVNTGWWNLGSSVHCTKISAKSECGGHSPLGAHPQKCGIGQKHWGNYRRPSNFYIWNSNFIRWKIHEHHARTKLHSMPSYKFR